MPGLPIPSIFSAIVARARIAPYEIAVVRPADTVTYRRFCADIDLVSRHLVAAGLPADSRVGVTIGGAYVQWLVAIALARLGVLFCTCTAANLPALAPTVVVTDVATLQVPGARIVQAGREWLAADAASLPPVEDRLHERDAPAVIVMSSGTTGVPKLALFTAAGMDERLRTIPHAYGMNAKTREFCMLGMSTIGGFVWPLGCWMSGGTVLLAPVREDQSPAMLLRDRPNMLFASTAQLEALVESLPAEFTPQPRMVAFVAGSALPRALNRKTRLRLTPQLMMIYGSTEVGTVTVAPAAHVDNKPGLTGYAFPPAEVQVVDENGEVLPHGTPGEVRTRNVGQTVKYLGDEETSAQAFRGTWFHPGDLGVMGPNGDLYIQGRVRELMNFGGVKVTPELLDEAFAGTPGVVELASFTAADERGMQRPHVAVVAGEDFAQEELVRRFKARWPNLPVVKVVQVPRLPRNDMGKIMRLELAAQASGKASSLH